MLCFYTEYIIIIMYINNVTIAANTTLFHLLENIKHLYFLCPFLPLNNPTSHPLSRRRDKERCLWGKKKQHEGSLLWFCSLLFHYRPKEIFSVIWAKEMNLRHYTEVFCLSMYDPLLEVLNGLRRNLVLEERGVQ